MMYTLRQCEFIADVLLSTGMFVLPIGRSWRVQEARRSMDQTSVTVCHLPTPIHCTEITPVRVNNVA